MSEERNADWRVVPILPDPFGCERGDPLPPDIIGATIVNMGTPSDSQIFEGGGLVIDYLPRGSGAITRVVIEFSDLGAWVALLSRRSKEL
jgi:hypothetical protein